MIRIEVRPTASCAEGRSLVLVTPPQHGLLEGFSSGLVALANHVSAVLPRTQVRFLDLGVTDQSNLEGQIKACVDEIDGELFVGITTTTASYQSALRVSRIFKLVAPECILILGGHHASAQDKVVLKHHTYVDFVVRGEGEVAVVELLRRYPDLENVPNISFRRGLNITRNDPAPLLDQSSLDRIAITFQGWGLHSAPGKFDHATYVSARGCPLRCSFCSVANERIRSKSVSAVIDDLRILAGKMGCRSIAIEDNFFAHSAKRTIELCRAIEHLQREIPFGWDCQTRVESCQREDVMEALESAGCEAVYLGVEAFDAEHLLYLGKTGRPGAYLDLLLHKVVPWLLRSQIACYINLQLGLPGEGQAHRNNTLSLLLQLGRQAIDHQKLITIFPQLHVVYPGTTHFQQAVIEARFGPESESVFEEFTKWEARQQPVLSWLGEHFAHGTGGIPEGILHTDRLRQGEFEVDSNAVLEAINYLDAMAATPGINVFKYGRYLARSRDVQILQPVRKGNQ